MTTVEIGTISKTRRDILLDAAAFIEEHGWTYGPAGMPGHPDHDGRLCLLGGIARVMKAAGSTQLSGGEMSYLAAASILFGKDHDPAYAYMWNDSMYDMNPDRAQKMATSALRKLADGATWNEAAPKRPQ